MDLLFERFLSESRGEWPDIDLDLPSEDDCERAIQYIYERYGELGAATTANVSSPIAASPQRGKSERLWVLILTRCSACPVSSVISSGAARPIRWLTRLDMRAWICNILALRSTSTYVCASRGCRVISGNIPVAW